jgi:hypothetical protein
MEQRSQRAEKREKVSVGTGKELETAECGRREEVQSEDTTRDQKRKVERERENETFDRIVLRA